MPLRVKKKSFSPVYLLLYMLFLFFPTVLQAQSEPLDGFDRQVRKWALECKASVLQEFESMLNSKQFTEAQLFDTFYIPIPGTDPQKYHTQYDRHTDKTLRAVFDGFLKKDPRLVFVIIVDRNGYLPTHNTRFSQPLTGDRAIDIKNSRTKRIFNDRTGLAGARNTQPFLLQRYSRDTGELMYDLSVPIFIKDRHWGAVRFGYKYK